MTEARFCRNFQIMYGLDIPEIEAELRAMGVSEAEFLAKAEVHKRTWDRLKAREYSPRADTARRIIAALKVLRAERYGNPPGGDDGDNSGGQSLAPVEVEA